MAQRSVGLKPRDLGHSQGMKQANQQWMFLQVSSIMPDWDPVVPSGKEVGLGYDLP